MEVNEQKIEISNPDKKLFPDDGFTKKDIVNYYRNIADYLLPHADGRPVMMQRFPDGIGNTGFYHKEAPDYFPEWIIKEKLDKKGGGKITHVICDKRETLVYLANQACITLHTWLSRVDKPENPDKVILDLDPPTEYFEQIRESLSGVKEFLEGRKINSFLMTTGSKGLHLVIPVRPERTFDRVKEMVDKLAEDITETFKDRFTMAQYKEKREGKIYLDSQRNSYAQTAVCPFSLRPIKGAPVATPISWEEALKKEFHARKYHIRNIFRRLGQVSDPWENYFDKDLARSNSEILFRV